MTEDPREESVDADKTDIGSYEDVALGIPDLNGALDAQRRTGDPVAETMVPAEHSRGVESYGTTSNKQRRGPGLDLRLSEETDDEPVWDE
jgi:hypothetical protein